LIPEERILVISDRSFLVFAVSAFLTLCKIRRLGIDSVLDLELFSRFTAVYSYLTGAPKRVGFHNYTDEGLFRGNFITHPVLYNSTQHISLNFLNLVHALAAPEGERPLLKQDVRGDIRPLPKHPVPAGEQERMWQRLAAESPSCRPGSKLVVLNPDPGLLSLRGWPVDKYHELSRRLLAADPRIVLVMIGLERSQPYAETIFRGLEKQRAVDFCGKTDSLADVLVLLSLSDALVTSDSGPAHIASLVELRTFVLFGPESPLRYAPLGPRVQTFYAHLSCSPCYSAANHRRSVCKDNKCMQRIEVDAVFSSIHSALASDG
jgi:ADP-heptose:LPS heptosyltransferase